MNQPFAIFLACSLMGSVPARSAQGEGPYNALCVFGDGVCTTTGNNSSVPSLYYGNRYCNGRVWVEVLSEWQDLTYTPSLNLSDYGFDSVRVLQEIAAFTPPSEFENSLVALWPGNADFVLFIGTNNYQSQWDSFIAATLTNHQTAIQNLYAKGARSIIVMNVVDLSSVPFFIYYTPSELSTIATRTASFNSQLNAMIRTLAPTLPGLTIHTPDVAGLFADVKADPATYGLIDSPEGALFTVSNPAIDGEGSDHIFWDDLHPTAKFQVYLADLIQQTVSPPTIESLTRHPNDCELKLLNAPVGRTGQVDGSSNLNIWTPELTFTPDSTTPSVTVPATESAHFYKVRYPVVWTWP